MTHRLFSLFLLLTPLLFADRFIQLQRELGEAEAQLKRAEQEYMFGNWYGWRYKIADKGIDFISSYATDMIANPVGGKAQGFSYAGSFGLGVNIDFERAVGAAGLDLFASAVWRTGTSLSRTKIKNQFPVQQLFGSETVKLNELFLSESLFDGYLILKAGRLNAGNDFLQSPLYYQFVSNAFDGNPISIFFNAPFSAYPTSQWGAYTAFKPYKRVLGKAAIYNTNNKVPLNKYHGCNFTFKSTNGSLWITEWAFLVNQEKEDSGMPGNYRAGFFYVTGDTQQFSNGTVRGDYCYYLLFDQMVYRPAVAQANRGLTPFAALIFAPKDRNLFPFFYTAGLVYQGPFASRPKDSLSLGMAYGKYSRDQAEQERQAGMEPQNFEAVIEANYWFQINNWFTITPDFQYIIHPRGLNIPNAFCIGAQIGFIL